jgi:nicotinamide-nucleotide amidase
MATGTVFALILKGVREAGTSPEGTLNRLLTERRLTLAVAESCTGGLISSRITDAAGASAYFLAGLVTYSNEAKEKLLSVPGDVIAARGAVSAEVAGRMAEGARRATGADIGLSVTGIAGPGGGTDQKPVGTVYMGLAAVGAGLVRYFKFDGERLAVKRQAADEALRFVLDYLEGRASS